MAVTLPRSVVSRPVVRVRSLAVLLLEGFWYFLYLVVYLFCHEKAIIAL